MASNVSLTSVVHLIFNQCKEPNCELVNADKIIEYIMNNFDYDNEEAYQLQFNELFQSLKTEGKYKDNLLSEEEFEKVFKIWLPSVENQSDELTDEARSFNDALINTTQNRLSRSLTNLKQQIDDDQKHNYCENWCHWTYDSPFNDENVYEAFVHLEDHIDARIESPSPHEDPFKIPLNAIRSTPIKKTLINPNNIGFLQQPNLRLIKNHGDFEQSSFSDTDVLSKYDGSFFESESNDDASSDRNRKYRKRHRSSIVGQAGDGLDTRDLIAQLRQIKFKNSQLVEINDRLQSQLELAEENMRSLNSKFMDLEKKNRHFTDVNEDNKQLGMEIDDIRKCIESELELKRRIQSEKIMTESELTAAKEYIQSLIDRLSVLDAGLAEKNKIIMEMKSVIKQQEAFCQKLQDLNSEKDGELQQNQKGIRKLTDAICEYEEKIYIISKERDDLEMKFNTDMIRSDVEFAFQDSEKLIGPGLQDRACGGLNDHKFRTSDAEFKPNLSYESPFSIKLELATELLDSPGDSPLCEKLYFDDESFNDSSDDTSFQMLNGLLSMITSLRMTLGQYREQLETASRSIKSNEHFSDEISLSYLSYLNDSISLLGLSTEKATSCQNQFNDTFNLLMKRISILRNEKKTLMQRNEKLFLQLNQSSNHLESDIAEKIYFLEEELRKERLFGLKKEKEIGQMRNTNEIYVQGNCLHCGRPTFGFDQMNEMSRENMALDLDNGMFRQHHQIQRRRSISECNNIQDNTDLWKMNNKRHERLSSASLRDLNKVTNSDDYLVNVDSNLPSDGDIERELEMCRNYNISTDNLANIPRYKISRTTTDDIDIEGLIENSWLEAPSKMEERRASVFAQVDNDMHNLKEVEIKHAANIITIKEFENVIVTPIIRRKSSSCSSSNDTSDGNSVDSHEERRKLAHQLETRTLRMQSRSPAPTLVGSSFLMEDIKSLTPSVNETDIIISPFDLIPSVESTIESPQFEKNESQPPYPNIEEWNNSVSTAIEPPERKQSILRSIPISNQPDSVDDNAVFIQSDVRMDLPTISIMEPSIVDLEQIDDSNNSINTVDDNGNVMKTMKVSQSSTNDFNNDIVSISLQSSFNKSNLSSCSSSVVGDEIKHGGRLSSKLRPKRQVRPHTIAGIGLTTNKSILDDTLSNCDEASVNGDMTDIQEAIDILNETSQSLILISPEHIENKFSEAMLIYRTDRPTVIDRALDSNNKCNKALTNVEQEFNILRHLIKNMSAIIEQPYELLPRIKTSISVLEKCVEYLSAKSEMLGSVKQEMKLSCLVDVIQTFNDNLLKERDIHLRELEELKNSVGMLNELAMNNQYDQSRPKRSLLAGKDPKTRFQIVAQTTATKTSILRQFTNSGQKQNSQPVTPDSSSQELNKSDSVLLSGRSSSNQSIGFSDAARKLMEDENFKPRKIAVGKFFPSTPSVDDSGDNLFQKGLTQGLRMNADQTLRDLRAQQSKFSSTLDALSDMIEESESTDGVEQVFNQTSAARFGFLKNKIVAFFYNLKTALGRMVYVTVGVIVMIGFLLPWIFIPANTDAPSFSVPLSRRRSYSFPSRLDGSDIPEQSPPSSPSFLPNINVIHHKPAAV